MLALFGLNFAQWLFILGLLLCISGYLFLSVAEDAWGKCGALLLILTGLILSFCTYISARADFLAGH